MKRRFADAFFYFALWNRRDEFHARVRREMEIWEGGIVTTRWVLMEVADGLADSSQRARVRPWFDRLENDPKVEVVGFEEELYRHGLALYDQRADKAWSPTDCISFVVMKRGHLREALTRDKHFGQAGFTAVFEG